MSDDASLNSYRTEGYRHLRGFLARDVATAFLARMRADFARQGHDIAALKQAGPLLRQPAAEIYGYHYVPMATLHWGMTPAMETLVGEELAPTYCYFRLYRAGDICRVHGDRPACEHSLSLTLAYSDDRPWALDVGTRRIDAPYQRADEAFGADEPYRSVAMQAGDAVLYQGVHHHHGRVTPNPNDWSAHLFLHWVARNGPYADQAFDGQRPPERVAL